MQNPDPNDPDRHLHRLQQTFGVTTRLQQLATKRRKSPTKISKDAEEKALLAQSKEMRTRRLGAMTPVHRFVCEVVGEHYGLECDEVVDGVIDDDKFVQLLDEFAKKDERMAVMFFYNEFQHPPVGKWITNLGWFENLILKFIVDQVPVVMCPKKSTQR